VDGGTIAIPLLAAKEICNPSSPSPLITLKNCEAEMPVEQAKM
jgi:hypothetical protein